jgi:hypothetical protein
LPVLVLVATTWSPTLTEAIATTAPLASSTPVEGAKLSPHEAAAPASLRRASQVRSRL